MGYKGTPVVLHNYLCLPNATPIAVGSQAWFAWLAIASSFYYMHPSTYRLSVRKEKRRNTSYWYAYLKVDSKLHNAYLGLAPALTAQRLETVTQLLLHRYYATRSPIQPE